MPSVFRITDVWSDQPAMAHQYLVDLDFEGTAGEERVSASSATFAVIAAIMAHGRPVYYSLTTKELSTDPFFGSHEHADAVPRPLRVIDFDPLWNLQAATGKLILILENRARAHVAISDPGLFVAWTLLLQVQTVLFDGSMLKTERETGTP
jgi:hypothetical protein